MLFVYIESTNDEVFEVLLSPVAPDNEGVEKPFAISAHLTRRRANAHAQALADTLRCGGAEVQLDLA